MITCNLCNASFQRQDHLKRHTATVHAADKYSKCPACPEILPGVPELVKHVKTTHPDGTTKFYCRECSEVLDTYQKLEEHEARHLSTVRNVHVCPHCSTYYKRKDHMMRHVRTQHLGYHVTCPVCNQVYKRKDHLVRHVREKHRMGYFNGQLVKASDILVNN